MLTVIIVSYNHEKYILECLVNVVEIENLKEILIIDDGSTDNTVSIVDKFIVENKLSGLIRLIQKPNAGLVDSLNLGLQLCQTEYVYFTASDDFPITEGMNIVLNEIKDGSDLIIAGAFNLFGGEKITPVYSFRHKLFFSLRGEQLTRALFLQYPHPILIQSTIFKTSYLRHLNGWDLDVPLDDYALFSKVFLDHINKDKKVVFIPDINICFYRHHGNNTYKRSLWLFFAVRDVINKYAPNALKDEAIGSIGAYYLYQCLKNKQLKWFLVIFRSLNPGMIFFCFKNILERIVQRK